MIPLTSKVQLMRGNAQNTRTMSEIHTLTEHNNNTKPPSTRRAHLNSDPITNEDQHYTKYI